MGFSLANDERTRASLVVLHSLFPRTDIDTMTLWWMVRSAAGVSRSESRSTFAKTLDLIAALRLAGPARGDRLRLPSRAGRSRKSGQEGPAKTVRSTGVSRESQWSSGKRIGAGH
jgi:hypothetical protein